MITEELLPKETCNRCGYSWVKRVPNPVRCPGCLSQYWKTPRRKPKPLKQIEESLRLVRKNLRLYKQEGS